MAGEKPIYSTATGSNRSKNPDSIGSYTPASGPCKMRLETKGRGGKAVTVLFNLPFATESEAVNVMKAMQASLGCGATFKNNQIELRGDMRERVGAYFAKLGLKLVKAGG
ncbi:MAG: translation initiation factor [Deltaproteobacteria bacterium]|nr:translation initiation factor [Deltaproteobacteria bacterium]